MKLFLTSFFIMLIASSSLFSQNGKKVFETYCWGCHHQTAVAFGPSFEDIASKRDENEIRAMITDPKSVSKVFGYKRNAMPSFSHLKAEELDAITAYILSFKAKKVLENNQTIIEELYPNIALTKGK
ncbi:MAG: cytochrome c [Campylobacterota bacterium]|nr:cytochrome c [Campylobacterota bacterium]